MKTPTPKTYLSTELAKFDPITKEVNDFLKDFTSVEIAGVFDDEGYKAAKSDVKLMKQYIKRIEDQRVEGKALFLEGGRAVDAKSKEVKAIIDPVLLRRIDQIVAIDDEKEKQRKAKALLRHTRLTDAGYEYSNGAYRVGIKIMHPSAIETASEEEFNAQVIAGSEESARLKSEDEAKKVEDDRLAKENAALRARLAEVEKVEVFEPAVSSTGAPTRADFNPAVRSAETPTFGDTPLPKPQLYKNGFDACRTLAIEVVKNTTSKKEIIQELLNLIA